MGERKKRKENEMLGAKASLHDILERFSFKASEYNSVSEDDKANGTNDKYIQIIRALRLYELLGDKNQYEVADAIGVTPSTLSDYLQKGAEPRSNILAMLGGYFNVSTDYLLGRTDIKTIDPTKKSACEYTGISDEAAEELHKINGLSSNPLRIKIISFMLKTGKINEIAALLERAVISSKQYELLYDTGNNEQIESLEFQFNKKMSSMYTSVLDDFSIAHHDEIDMLVDKRWEDLQNAAIEVKEKMEKILENFTEQNAAYINDLIKKDPSAP